MRIRKPALVGNLWQIQFIATRWWFSRKNELYRVAHIEILMKCVELHEYLLRFHENNYCHSKNSVSVPNSAMTIEYARMHTSLNPLTLNYEDLGLANVKQKQFYSSHDTAFIAPIMLLSNLIRRWKGDEMISRNPFIDTSLFPLIPATTYYCSAWELH